jgi:hypothetical protein
MADVTEDCRVYWGHGACGLQRGHDDGQRVRVHRQLEPVEEAVTVEDAYLFGEDLTAEEQRLKNELW